MAREVRQKVKNLVIESIFKDPEFILNYLCYQFKEVESLTVERISNFNRDWKSAFASIRFCKNLKILKIRECKMNDKQFDNLMGYTSKFKIKEIDVSGNNISSPKSFSSVIDNKKLRKLVITRNQLKIEQVRSILKCLKNSHNIRHIDLSSKAAVFSFEYIWTLIQVPHQSFIR